MTIIVGIDPGSRITGYGVIAHREQQLQYVASGCIRVQEADLADRLLQIHDGLSEILHQYQPQCAAIEEVFFHRNPKGAIKLGQARGVALVGLARYGLAVAEYSPRQIKQAVVGYGAASKQQIQHMVQSILQLSQAPQADAADGLAIAICHAHMQSGLEAYQVHHTFSRGRVKSV